MANSRDLQQEDQRRVSFELAASFHPASLTATCVPAVQQMAAIKCARFDLVKAEYPSRETGTIVWFVVAEERIFSTPPWTM